MKARTLVIAMTLLSITLLISGCIGGGSPTPSTTPAPTTEAPTTTPAPTTSPPTTLPPTTEAPTTTPPPFSEQYYFDLYVDEMENYGIDIGSSSIADITEGLPGRYILTSYVTHATSNDEYLDEMEKIISSYAVIVGEGTIVDGIFLSVLTEEGTNHSCWYCRSGWAEKYVSGAYSMEKVLDLCVANGSNM